MAWVGGVPEEFPARWGMWSLLRLIVGSWDVPADLSQLASLLASHFSQ